MNRRRFLQQVAAPAALMLFANNALAQTTPQKTANTAKPNIVVMIADDLTYSDLGCWGNKDVKTPNLDRLAAQGMRLTSCYTTAPVCSPTRQALYTGLYPVRSGAYPNHAIVKPGVKSLPHYLKPLGYRVGLVGKQHYGPAENFPFEYPGQDGGAEDEENENAEKDLNYGAAEQFINRDKKQPYLLVVAAHEPHSPWNKGDASVYKPADLKLPPYLVDTPLTRRALSNYYGEVTYLDQQVGRVMDFVDKSGQADNTLFLFVSEQGSSLPHGKWTLYDVGIRSATIARWPAKIKAGSTSNALCQYIDFLPTFMEMGGGKADTNIDGRSILKVLTGESTKARDYVFAEETSRGIIAGPEAYGIRAVADDRWKYILNLNSDAEFMNTETRTPRFQSWVKKGETDAFAREQAQRYKVRPAVELYDLQNDPFEMKNIADQPDQKANLTRLRSALDGWMKQQGDEGVKTEMEAKEHQGSGQAKRRAGAGAGANRPNRQRANANAN
ncbi:sulfatase atsG [bacterium]|nr:MAG: sulfatase atsG [bacterium]